MPISLTGHERLTQLSTTKGQPRGSAQCRTERYNAQVDVGVQNRRSSTGPSDGPYLAGQDNRSTDSEGESDGWSM